LLGPETIPITLTVAWWDWYFSPALFATHCTVERAVRLSVVRLDWLVPETVLDETTASFRYQVKVAATLETQVKVAVVPDKIVWSWGCSVIPSSENIGEL